jgi:hypothetical protein
MAYRSRTLITIPNPIHLAQRLLRKETTVPRSLLKINLSSNKTHGATFLSVVLGRGVGYPSGATIFAARNCHSRMNGKEIPFTYGFASKDWRQIPWIAS